MHDTFKSNRLTNVIIPNGVTKIQNSAFDHNELTSVTIPDSVTTIEDYAFYNNQLTSITIPDSVTSLGKYAFSSNQLTSINLPKSLIIEKSPFSDNPLKSVTIPDGTTEIGPFAFEGNKLTSITIPDSVTRIYDSAFEDNQLTNVTIPNGVKKIGSFAFKGNQLSSLLISNSVTKIGDYAFKNNQLTSVIIPNSVTSIGDGAFSNNILLNVSIPNSITEISESTFNQNRLTNVDIPESVTKIGDHAFSNNPLTSVTIPDSVTRFGLDTFDYRLTDYPTQIKDLHASIIESDSLKLKWKKQDVTGYQVFRYDTDSNSYKLFETISRNIGSYTMSNLRAGTTYRYKVRSFKTLGILNYYGTLSSEIAITTNLPQVKNLVISKRSSNSLKLTWSKQNDVTGYKIYQYDSKNKLLKTITSKSNSYELSKLTPGTTYQFKIRSYKTNGKTNQYRPYSDVLKTTTNPGTVVSSVKKDKAHSIKVNWKSIASSSGYQIQYSTSSKFASSKTKSVTIASKNTVTKTIKNLKKGKKYYVKVRAYKTLSGKSYYGSWSTIKNVTVK